MNDKIKVSGNPPKRFYVDPEKLTEVALSAPQFAVRLGSGAFVDGYKLSIEDEKDGTYSILKGLGKQIKETGKGLKKIPIKPIEIYEFEGCPFCRKVREAVSILDIDVLFLPCPKGGPNFRLKASKLGGKKQFPFMVDLNTKVQMYESDEIIKYLFETYSVSIYKKKYIFKTFSL
jgi:hypothetical protein